jgi:hypothetical protein
MRRVGRVVPGQRAVPRTALSWRVCWIALATALFGCESPPPSVYVSSSQRVPAVAIVAVGSNQVGEPCHYQSSTTGDFGIGAQRAVNLCC